MSGTKEYSGYIVTILFRKVIFLEKCIHSVMFNIMVKAVSVKRIYRYDFRFL